MNNILKTIGKRLPLFAAVLGVGLAFAQNRSEALKSKDDGITMYYHGANYSQVEVQNKNNWNTTAQDCDAGNDLACQVTVDGSYVSSGSFISTISLIAETGSAAALLSVQNSGSPISAEIQNRD